MKYDVGVIGLGVMGSNLALNFDNKGFDVSVYNFPLPGEENKVLDFIFSHNNRNIRGGEDLLDFVVSLKTPRVIVLMLKAGVAVDEVLEQLLAICTEGDILIDGGNSMFLDSIRRSQRCNTAKIHFVGMGISGGKEGALHGPALMVSGDDYSRDTLMPMMHKIAARHDKFGPCISWSNGQGSGHFIKMVHNGIEYAEMQIIGEIYQFLHRIGKSDTEIATIFSQFNEMDGYLFSITQNILQTKKNRDFLHQIEDIADHKGTTKWLLQTALELEVPLPIIQTAYMERIVSNMPRWDGNDTKSTKYHSYQLNYEVLENAMLMTRYMAMIDGISILEKAGNHYGWDIDILSVLKSWTDGCIIRSKTIEDLVTELQIREYDIASVKHILTKKVKSKSSHVTDILKVSMDTKVSLPCISASVQAFYSLIQDHLHSIAMIQAQRDYFGNHGVRFKQDHSVHHVDWFKP
jgi:6-phosphogluconate dehydrogenase